MYRARLSQHFWLARFRKASVNSERRRWLSWEAKQHDPLKILFCGADEFSIYSLRTLRKLQDQEPGIIESIEIACRPDKRVGRGLKQIQEVPIKSVAKELNLPIHQIDTFTGWSPSAPVDLIVAVSFGLLVPSRILKGATYGGLNVHPSMLPDFRGPAPIQHALLRGRTHTGVTLQTMHPTRFDHGMILAQTPTPGIAIPDDCTPNRLIHTLGSAGADMLRNAVKTGLFLSPTSAVALDANGVAEHAPKITPEDRRIDWTSWTAGRVNRYGRVLDKLWDTTTYKACWPDRTAKRVTFNGPWRQVPVDSLRSVSNVKDLVPGLPMLSFVDDSKQPCLALPTVDGRAISPSSATVEGEQKGKALPGLISTLRERL